MKLRQEMQVIYTIWSVWDSSPLMKISESFICRLTTCTSQLTLQVVFLITPLSPPSINSSSSLLSWCSFRLPPAPSIYKNPQTPPAHFPHLLSDDLSVLSLIHLFLVVSPPSRPIYICSELKNPEMKIVIIYTPSRHSKPKDYFLFLWNAKWDVRQRFL